jgi:hypothetical protein
MNIPHVNEMSISAHTKQHKSDHRKLFLVPCICGALYIHQWCLLLIRINPLLQSIPTCVPTGIKTGVSTSQCNKRITLDRALHTSHFALIWKLSAALFPRVGIFNTFETLVLWSHFLTTQPRAPNTFQPTSRSTIRYQTAAGASDDRSTLTQNPQNPQNSANRTNHGL